MDVYGLARHPARGRFHSIEFDAGLAAHGHAHHLFVDGQQLKTATEITSIVICGKSTKTAWEDSGNSVTTGPQWSHQDIVFTVDATTCAQNANVASPIKIVR